MEKGYEVYEWSRRGNLQELREALRSMGPDDYLAYDGSTALVMAARSGHCHVFRELLTSGASVKVRTDDGSNILCHAVSGQSVEIVEAILAAGVEVDEANEDGITPLMLAAHYGLVDIVQVLCDAGADLNSEAEGWGTVLDSAEGAVAELLESRGARRSQGGADQPLAKGSERFHYGCFEMGENPNVVPDKAPPPVGVARWGAEDTVEQPLAVGANVRLRRPKTGLLKDGDVGIIVEDDGSDCVPLKVKVGESHDYYDRNDLVVCAPAIDLPPDSDRATAEGTARYLATRLSQGTISTLGSTGLCISPLGFGCHRVEDEQQHKDSLKLAIQMGCNFIDTAPNYTDGVAERVLGDVLKDLMSTNKIRRDEIVIATKVGNVLGKQMAHANGVPKMTKINENLSHCISPAWIEQELTRSLERMGLQCVDCLLLHCPEFEVKGEGVDLAEVYKRLGEAFVHLEKEVANGRVGFYGVSAAFYPLRPTDSQHLDLSAVLARLPSRHHFRVLQFPLNFAEAQCQWVAHTPRRPDGIAIDKEKAQGPTLFEIARNHNLATLINRPLDGIYKESHGVLRFSSLDCDVRSFSELQLDNCDSLEEKLTSLCKLGKKPYQAGDGASGRLAAKTVKVLASLQDVDCVLLGMRRPEYVLGTLPLVFGTPPLPADAAATTLRALHNTIEMWFATAIHEADHGTAKDWRLPVDQKGVGDKPQEPPAPLLAA